MGQQPNVELDDANRSVGEHAPPAPMGWRPTRAGEINGPDEMMLGGLFGNPSPDAGWAMKLVRRAEFERSGNLEQMVATIAAARASVFGRGPVPQDVEVALIVLGLRPDGLPDDLLDRLTELRVGWINHSSHETTKGRSVLAVFSRETLASSPDELKQRLADLVPQATDH